MRVEERETRVAVALEILEGVVVDAVREFQEAERFCSEHALVRAIGLPISVWGERTIRYLLERLEKRGIVENQERDGRETGMWRLGRI